MVEELEMTRITKAEMSVGSHGALTWKPGAAERSLLSLALGQLLYCGGVMLL